MKKYSLLLLFALILNTLCAQELKVNDYPHFRIAVAGGYSHRTAYIASEYKNGFHYGVELNYYFKIMGIGLNYSGNQFYQGVNIHQFIPTVNMRIFDYEKRGAFLANIGAGYVGNRNGATIGMLLGLGYDIPLSQTMAIYAQASISGGKLKRAEYDVFMKEFEYEKLGLLKLSLGLRFAK